MIDFEHFEGPVEDPRIAALEAALAEAGDGRIDYLLREINAALARISALEAELEASNNRADVAYDMMREANSAPNGAIEALERLPGPLPDHDYWLSTEHSQWRRGWNAYHVKVQKAIEDLKKEGGDADQG